MQNQPFQCNKSKIAKSDIQDLDTSSSIDLAMATSICKALLHQTLTIQTNLPKKQAFYLNYAWAKYQLLLDIKSYSLLMLTHYLHTNISKAIMTLLTPFSMLF